MMSSIARSVRLLASQQQQPRFLPTSNLQQQQVLKKTIGRYFSTDTVFLNGEYMPKEEAKISPQDRGFLFGDGIYEAMPFYHGRPFALEQHLKRLENGLSFLRIPYDVKSNHLLEMFQNLISKNELDTSKRCMTYIQITRGAPMIRNHAFSTPGGEQPTPTIYAFCQEIQYPSVERWNQGFTCALVPDRRWGRVDMKTVNLLANVLGYQDAKDQGCDEAILHKDGMALEGAHGNFWAILDDDKNTIVTHPTTHEILPGITRAVLLEEARRDGRFVVEERPLTLEELRDNVKEAFFTSTTVELKPAVSVDGKPIGDGRAGNVTRELWTLFQKRIERDTGVKMLYS
mgnify:CR=1 FL=1